MSQGIGDGHENSPRAAYARSEVRRLPQEGDRVRAACDEAPPPAGKPRVAAPRTFEAARDAHAGLAGEGAPAASDAQARSPVAPFDTVRARRLEPRGTDACLDAGRRGERPVAQQLFRQALAAVTDPVPREVVTANRRGVLVPGRANRRIRMLTEAVGPVVGPERPPRFRAAAPGPRGSRGFGP